MDKLKVSMTQEDINKAFKWSRDTIEAQKAEIERQRGVLERIYAAHGCSVTIEPWCSTCGKNVHTIECQKCSEFWVANDLEKLNMQAEIERLREACRLWVGYDDLDCGNEETTLGYAQALAQAYNLAIDTTRAALQPEEGK